MRPSRLGSSIVAAVLAAWTWSCPAADVGVVPVDARGEPLNLGFEAGSLKDWHAQGDAFDRMAWSRGTPSPGVGGT